GQPLSVWQMNGAMIQSCAKEKLMAIEGIDEQTKQQLNVQMTGIETDLGKLNSLSQTLSREPANAQAAAELADLMKKYNIPASGDARKDVAALTSALTDRQAQIQSKLELARLSALSGADKHKDVIDIAAEYEKQLDELDHQAIFLLREIKGLQHDAEDLDEAEK